MRQRKRPDWPIRVYRYGVQLEHQAWQHLPPGVKQETEAMRSLWNQLIDTFQERQAEYQRLISQLPQVTHLRAQLEALQQQGQQADTDLKTARQRLRRRNAPELVPLQEIRQQLRTALLTTKADLRKAQRSAAETARPALHQLQVSFFAAIRRVAAQSSVTWANREFVVSQFLAAVTRFFKKQEGPPKPKFGVPQQVHFHHHFGDGGLPAARLFGRGQRVHLEPVPLEGSDPALSHRQRRRLARTTGTFRVGDTSLLFSVLLHRSLPDGTYLKAAALVGKQVGSRGYHRHPEGGHMIPARWSWSLQLTVEIPPQVPPTREQERPVAAIDLSYRLWGHNQLRIGTLVDSNGGEEGLFLPERILKEWNYKRELQKKADQILEEAKARLQTTITEAAAFPPAVQNLVVDLGPVRAAGLWHLLQVLEETGEPRDALDIVHHWADRTTRILREVRGLERGYLGHRDWFYHNLAMRLCRRYRQLIVEALDLQVIASRERIAETPRLREAAKYRQLAALSRFLLCLRQAAAKTDTKITAVEPAYTTQECQVCGARVPANTGAALLVCPNGHQWDQDSNAARNLLRRATPAA